MHMGMRTLERLLQLLPFIVNCRGYTRIGMSKSASRVGWDGFAGQI